MNKPKTHDNRSVQEFLFAFAGWSDLHSHVPSADDIVTGALELKTAGDSSTRTLSRRRLFHILRQCSQIDVESVGAATGDRLAYTTLASYAARARVASKALERFIAGRPRKGTVPTLRQEQQMLDAPFHEELRAQGLLSPESNF
jgi:hypothetical protein